MKKVVWAFVAVASLLAAPALAAQFISQDVPRVEAGQTIDDDLFIAGSTIIIDGTVNGDVYAAGESITVNGTVNGDVYAVASQVTISGTVRDDLVTAAQKIQINSGKIGDSVVAASENLITEEDSSIGGGLLFAASVADIRSKIGRGITAAGEKISLGSETGRGVLLGVGTLTLNSGTKINGNLEYTSDTDLIKNQGSEVTGQVKRNDAGENQQAEAGIDWGYVIWSLLSTALVGLVLMRLMPTAAPAIANVITKSPLPALGWGILVLLLSVPVILLLVFSIIGIPLAILAAILFGVLIYFSKIFSAVAIGNLIAARTEKPANSYLYFLLGLLILGLAGLLPIIGGFVKLIALLFGLGGVAGYFKSRMRNQPKPAAPKPVVAKAAK